MIDFVQRLCLTTVPTQNKNSTTIRTYREKLTTTILQTQFVDLKYV